MLLLCFQLDGTQGRHEEVYMETISYPRSIARPSLDSVIENAVVLGWNELMPPATPGVIQVEYHTGPERLLEYLKVWASTERGYWSLVCEYWKCSLWSHVPGLSFGKSYQPGDFSRRLESVMQHENDFAKLPQQDGSIYIRAPTEGERLAAADSMPRVVGEPHTNTIVPAAAA
jgi:hypothetical protein